MEYYSYQCPKCHDSFSFVGYKTGIGKNEAQLAEMRSYGHVCRRCGYDDRVGEDHGPLKDTYIVVPLSRYMEIAERDGAYGCACCEQRDLPFQPQDPPVEAFCGRQWFMCPSCEERGCSRECRLRNGKPKTSDLTSAT